MKQKERLEALAEVAVPEAIEWVNELRKYRIYQGKDPEYFKKAKIGLGVLGRAVSLSATIENSRGNDLIESRVKVLEAGTVPEPKRLSGAK